MGNNERITLFNTFAHTSQVKYVLYVFVYTDIDIDYRKCICVLKAINLIYISSGFEWRIAMWRHTF